MKKEGFKQVKTTSISAVIPVKFDSTRCPEKNYRKFANSSLIDICVQKLKSLGFINEIIISVDSEKILPYLEHLSDVKIILRDADLIDPMIPMNMVYKHLANICSYDHILYTSCTTPLLKVEHYKMGYDKWVGLDFIGSVHSVTRVSDFLLRDGSPLNFEKQKFPRSQDLPNILKLVYGFSFIQKPDFLKGSSLSDEQSSYLEVDFPYDLDIDTQLDFDIAEILYGRI